MICPPLTIAARTLPHQYQDPAQCSESACAWWDQDAESCVFIAITRDLVNIKNALQDLAENVRDRY